MSAPKLNAYATTALTALLLAACGGDTKPDSTAPAKNGTSKADTLAKGDATATAERATEKVKHIEGPAPGSEDRFELAIDAPTATVGEPSQVTVRVVPRAPWHMNLDFPTSFRLEPPKGVTLTKADLKKGDATKLDEQGCQFDVAFTPGEAGEQTFTGEFKFAVCQDEACSPVTHDVEFKVAVNDSAPMGREADQPEGRQGK